MIIPGQRELERAKQDGRAPDPRFGAMGRERSVHNTYFTLPVLFTMISTHYAGLYGHPWNWVLLIPISMSGAPVRVWFVQRHKGEGVVLETPSQIQAMAAAINQQVAVTRVMPPGNMTHTTDAERRMIARWFAGGAQ